MAAAEQMSICEHLPCTFIQYLLFAVQLNLVFDLRAFSRLSAIVGQVCAGSLDITVP